jgi:hypothetical protein
MSIRTLLRAAPIVLLLLLLGAEDEPPAVKIGQGCEMIMGGFDPAKKEDVPRLVAELEQTIPKWKRLGVTSHESYVRWNLCEPDRGRYDWSVYDPFVELYKKHQIKWVPFLIVGPAYSLPDWYHKKEDAQGYVCLEHGQESDVQSLWNPVMRAHVSRFIEAFCKQYRDSGAIESILLGVTGNYGEAIYPATGNDWTADTHGQYHTHAGMWAGDPYAIKSFRDWLRTKYATDEKLTQAWSAFRRDPKGSAFAVKIDEVKPFLRADAPNDRAWVDQIDWYTQSMTEYAEFWLRETRKHFDGPIYLCTGGHAPPEHGADFAQQCRAAAKVNGGVRITNEASDYGLNFALTRWVASSSRQYGAYFSIEPAGDVKPHAVVSRVYNATASGAKGLHWYHPNLFGSDEARQNFERWGAQWRLRKPITEIAVYYPSTDTKLNGQHFIERARYLRDRFDFDMKGDDQILDGGLTGTKALVILFGTTSERKVWDAVQQWVDDGGVLIFSEGLGKLRTVEGDRDVHERLIERKPVKGRVVVQEGGGDDMAYREFITAALASCEQLAPNTRRMVQSDGKEDGAYVTLCEDELLWLNVTGGEVQTTVTLPPNAIVSEPLE